MSEDFAVDAMTNNSTVIMYDKKWNGNATGDFKDLYKSWAVDYESVRQSKL